MSSFNRLSLLTVLLLSMSSLVSCGKKAALYHPDEDKGAKQSNQSFVFPPKTSDNPDSTQP